ncbi:MAG: amidohydrolase family protein [Thalassotalea sp.]
MKRVDSHQHFWQLSRGDYDWLTPELKVLYRDFLPADLSPLLAQAQVNKTVLVQAAATTAETEYMLQLAEENNFVAGVVGWVDMTSDNALIDIENFSKNPYFKGIRPMLQDIEDVNWMLQAKLAPVFEMLIAKNLTFDALVLPKHLDALYQLLIRYPALNVVIDHGAKPNIAEASNQEWFEKITLIAAETSALCKLSGLVTEAGNDPHLEQLRPYMDHLLHCFGPSRLMWGSDWPVLEISANYKNWLEQVENFLEPLTSSEQQSIWAGTVTKFYRL